MIEGPLNERGFLIPSDREAFTIRSSSLEEVAKFCDYSLLPKSVRVDSCFGFPYPHPFFEFVSKKLSMLSPIFNLESPSGVSASVGAAGPPMLDRIRVR